MSVSERGHEAAFNDRNQLQLSCQIKVTKTKNSLINSILELNHDCYRYRSRSRIGHVAFGHERLTLITRVIHFKISN
jgi:hypothetical protein